MKKTDLEKSKAKKIDGSMRSAGIPDRFAQGAAGSADKREQRRRDAAAGLVPFACKLPLELTRRLTERAASVDGGINALVEQMLTDGLSAGD